MSDGETVVDVLEGVESDDVRNLYHYITTDGEHPESLSYEDWVHPMKASGGRIAIKETLPYEGSESVLYYTIEHGDTLVCRNEGKEVARTEKAIRWFKHAMQGDIEPVLASETPSGGPGG